MSGFEPPGRGPGSGSGEGGDFDADELRRRMHEVVSDIEPADGSLERLRHAVPARRRRRSAVMAGTSALVMVAALAAAARGGPGWIASVTRSVERTATIGGSGGVNRQGTGTNGSGAAEQQGRTGGVNGPSGTPSTTPTPGKPSATPTPSPSSTVTPPRPGNPALPPCGMTTLGRLTVTADTVVNGVTYGHVDGTVVSSCDLASQPAVAVTPSAGVGQSVPTIDNSTAHYQGLPDVTPSAATIVVQGGSSFQFQFAWVPATCSPGSSGSSDGTAGEGASAGAGTGSAGGPGADAGAGDASDAPTDTPTPTGTPTPPAGYQIEYSAAANGPTAMTTLDAACGASVYVTAVYPSGQYPLASGTS